MSLNEEMEKLEDQRLAEVAQIKTDRFNRLYFPEDFHLPTPPQHHDDELGEDD